VTSVKGLAPTKAKELVRLFVFFTYGVAVDTKCTTCEGAGRVFKTIRHGNTIYQTQAGNHTACVI
jgi:hypothetical protein